MSLGTLGRYVLDREIARSNDIVYEGYDPELKRRVAIKELHVPDGISDKDKQLRKERFKREARAAGRLEHPNIVSIYEVDEKDGRSFIVMEFLEGETLRQRMDRDEKISPDDAVKIFDQVLDGLAFAHDNGVVHRDIKPENIQILPNGRVVITDFGIARLQFEPSITVDGQIFGTPSYMSPEQVVGRDVDPRSDIWSCGVVLYEMLTGRKPFTGETVVTVSHRILHAEPPEMDNVPLALAQVVRRAMSKDPSDRYGSAKELKAALNDALAADSNALPSADSHWGPPIDPYRPAPGPYSGLQPSPVGGPSIQSTQSSGYAPAGAYPYGQPYGASLPPGVPMSPFPPGWVNPPKQPLLSQATKVFLLRTLVVVLTGGLLLALAVGVIAWLDRRSAEEEAARYDRALADDIAQAEDKVSQDPEAAEQQLADLRRLARSTATKERIDALTSRAYVERARRLLEDSATKETLRRAASLAELGIRAAGENGQASFEAAQVMYEIAIRSTDREERLSRFLEARSALLVAYDDGEAVRKEAGRLLAKTCLQIALMYEDDSARSSLFLTEGIRYAEEVGDTALVNELQSRLQRT